MRSKMSMISFLLMVLCLTVILPQTAYSETLTTTYADNNGYNGNVFDIVAINRITITQFDMNLQAGSHNISIYHRDGSYVGHIGAGHEAEWTLVGTTSVTSSGPSAPTNVPIVMSITVSPGQTHAFYLVADSTSVRYTNGTAEGNVYVSDGNLQVLEGRGVGVFPGDSSFSPRIWNGTIYYNVVNRVPTAANNTVTTNEDTAYSFTEVEFNFSDLDAGDTLQKIKITQLETAGDLELSGTDITLNQEIPVAQIGDLTFTPGLNENGTGYANFKFMVSDGTDYSTASYTMTIDVTAVNDDPTDISLTSDKVDENEAVGTTVGTFSTSDPDTVDTHTYTLVAGTGSDDNASFSISGSDLKTAEEFDFETKNSYSIRVRTTDSGTGNLTYEEVFTITINDANEAPTDIALTSQDIDENEPVNAVVGAFSSTDQDPGDTHTYSLVAGVGDTDNASFNISGSNLRSSAVFDYETKNSYSIRVRTTDSGTGSLTYEEVFTISVNDLNETPTADFSALPVSGIAPLTVDFTDASTDPENNINSWSWDFDNNGTVDSSAQNPTHIYNQAGTYTVKLTVTDTDGATDDETKTGYITALWSLTIAKGGTGTAVSTITAGTGSDPVLSPGGSAPGTYGYKDGDVVTLTATGAPPPNGADFVNWTGDVGTVADTNAANTTVTMNDQYTITGNFIGNYQVTFNASGPGTLIGTTTQIKHHGEDCSTVTASVNVGDHAFVGWTIDSGDTKGTFSDLNLAALDITDIQGDIEVTANFVDTYILTLEAGGIPDGTPATVTADPSPNYPVFFPGGSTSGSIPDSTVLTYADGDVVSLSAVYDSTIDFDGWTDDSGVTVAATDTTTVTMTSGVTRMGNFTQTYTITATARAGGTISDPGDSRIRYGDDKSYTISANVDYVNSDVVVDGASQGPLPSYTFSNVIQSHTIVAVFSAGDTPYQPPSAGDDQIYTAGVPPIVMMVMGRNHKLYYEAYNDASDLNGDGTLDIRYNPAIDYYGYFDCYKVYKYDTTNERFYPVRATVDKKTSGNPADNEWSGDFLNYLTMSRMDTLRKVLYGGYRSTDTATETVLQRVFIPQDAHSWGKEYKDEATDGYHISDYAPFALPTAGTRHLFASTTLEDTATHKGQFNRPLLRTMPNNAHRIWEWVAKERPVCDTSLQDYGSSGHPGHPNDHADYETMVLTYAQSQFQTAGHYGSGAPPNGRIDGQGNPWGDGYDPYSSGHADQQNYLTIFTGDLVITAGNGGDYEFAVDGDDAVEVIIDGTVVAGWYGGHGKCNCQTYSGSINLSSGTHTIEFRHEEAGGGDNYYLWWNGPQSGGSWEIVPDTAFSGLTQSTYDLSASTGTSTITDYVVRVVVGDSSMPEVNCKQYPNGTYKPVGILQRYGEAGRMYFGLMTGSYDDNTDGGVLRKRIGPINDEIDAGTGQFLTPADGGIVDTINKLRVINFNYQGSGSNYSYNVGCGWIATRSINPGECRMWGNPVAEMMYEGMRYFAGRGSPTSTFTDAATTDDSTLGLPTPTWDDPYVTHNYCAKPFLLVLSDIYPTYDSDDLPGANSNFDGTFSGDLTGLDVEDLADMILPEEGDEGVHYIGQLGTNYDGSCVPKDMDGFGDVRGLCPEEPTKQGSYYSPSIAYYGRVNDINPAEGDQNVLTYVVGLASALPRIEIPMAGDKTITLVPFAKSVGGYGISSSQGAFQPTNTIVDFFVQEITPTYGKFRINYEDVEQGADHDMDAICEYEYQVTSATTVDITLTSTYAAGSIQQHMGYVISGTTKDGTYLEVRDVDTTEGSDPDYFLDTPPGVWAGDGGTPWDDNTHLPLETTRTFTVGTTAAATLLNDPLWYAAKWGGFNELNENDKPDQISEWDEDSDGVPDTYFYVVNPLKLEQQLNQSFTDILSRGVSHVAPVVSVDEANRTQSGDKLYMAFFRPMPDSYWQGNLKKYGLEYMTRTDCGRTEPEFTVVGQTAGVPAGRCDGTFKPSSTSFWSSDPDGGYVDRGGVGALLKESMPGTDTVVVPSTGPYYSFRNIYTYKGASDGTMVRFNHANITNADLEVASDEVRGSIINFMYGYTYGTQESGTTPVAKREWILGDIIHSEPRIIDYFNTDGSLYSRYVALGSNDGMLHVFTDEETTIDGTTYEAGDEIFAFVPQDLLKRLKEFGTPDVHVFMVDGSANLFRAETKTGDYYDKTLVFGERRGGRSYWALDVTSPDPGDWKVRWHIEGGSTGTAGFEELGYTWNKPLFAKIKTDSGTYNAAIFAGGYDYPLEDGFPEGFDDADEDGIWDFTDANSNGVYDVGEVSEAHAVTVGGTEFYDKYNPGKNTMGRGIFVVDVDYDTTDTDHDDLILFKATYGDDDGDEDESEDVTTGLDQKYCKMKYCFPADISAIPFSDTFLVMYAADVYGQIWKITFNYFAASASERWSVKRVFTSNPGSDLESGDVDTFNAKTQSLNAADTGRKMFYSPDISYFGNSWTSYPVLYFGTGDRAHPRYRMISNRFYVLADHDALDGQVLDETDLFNLTCDELDDDADADHDYDVDDDDLLVQEDIRTIIETQEPCRGFYRVLDKQGEGQGICTGDTTDHTGEQMLSQPTLFFKTVYFTSYQAVFDDPCNPMGNAFIYALDYSEGTAAFNYFTANDTEQVVTTGRDTFQMISGSSIPSGVRVITRDGHAAGVISAGGAVAGAGEDLSTSIPGPPGGVSRLWWETD